MYAKIEVYVPDERGQDLLDIVNYRRSADLTLRQLLDNKLGPIKEFLGPEGTVTVTTVGMGTL